MAKIVDVAELNGCSALFLDNNIPSNNWNTIIIDGKRYSPVPVYDIEGVVAVAESGFLPGQIVEFE